MVKCVSTIRDLRLVLETWRRRDETVGFVSTMGALHEGHKPVIQQVQSLATRVVVSVFVNPLLFPSPEEFNAHPRTPDEDDAFLTRNGCDLLFCPTVEAMFPTGYGTMVDPGSIGTVLEGAINPGFFTGVATITTKLLLQVMPDYACFGENAYQQFRVIEQVVNDLQIPVGIIPVPILRDDIGLPYARRSEKMSTEEKEQASLFPKAMENAVEMIRYEHDIDTTLAETRLQLENAGFSIDYLEFANTRTLTPVRDLKKPARLFAAVRFGKTRIVDNWIV